MKFEKLKLSNQLCFPLYAASRLITREYKPYLEKLEITYPQYLVLLVLWETNGITINEISSKLILNTNTLTPLLKRMETMEIISRNRADKDERKVIISLTEKGKEMRTKAASIPQNLVNRLQTDYFSIEKLIELRDNLNTLVDFLKQKEENLD